MFEAARGLLFVNLGFLGLFGGWRKLGIFLGFWWNRLILLSIGWGLDWIG